MYLYRPNRILDLFHLLIYEREKQAEEKLERARVESCLSYMADLCWVMASGQQLKKDALEPFSRLMQKAQKPKPQQEEEDFFTILKNRVENRRKGGDPA